MALQEGFMDRAPLITDLNQIEKLAAQNKRENLEFFSRIQRDQPHSDTDLDAIVSGAADRVEVQIDCKTCGNCCRKLHIVVDSEDIGRLAHRQGISIEGFEQKFTISDGEGTSMFEALPCPFLIGNICSVYEDRPKCCRDFPHLHGPNFRSRTSMMITFSAMCPIVYNTVENLKGELG